MDGTPYISLIIPAFDEGKLLPRSLERVQAAQAHYRRGADAAEVIVADNGSTDRTAAIATEAGARVVRVEKRRIAAARNGGAAIARAQILAFMDADTGMHPGTFNAIDAAMASGKFAGGATGWNFERNSAGLAATRFVVGKLVTGLLRMDGGVVFCSRAAFDAVGGYNEAKDIAEDVEFFRAVRAYGTRNGLGMKMGTPEAPAIVCTRKFDEHGDWHMFYMAWWPLLKWKSMRKVVDEYWYPEKR